MIAFLGGALSPDARAAVEEHISACSACAELVTWAAADQATSTMPRPGREGRPFVGDLHPGARVGRYQILGALGRGGMGEVYAAYHPDLDRRIALKVVHGLDGRSGERRVRLLREARAIARLSHPNVITVHDAGTFGDRVFIAMELVDGQTITDWLEVEPRTWRQILDVFIAAGRGLAAAHAAGVIHRDFKPQNVMIGKNGIVRVMDFGLAQLAEEDPAGDDDAGADSPPLPVTSVTKTGAIVGTPAYMSPEQLRREGTDERSDQFSFCVALHEALYGTRPAAALADTGDPALETSKPSARAGAPSWLGGVVRRGASIDRARRYGSMNELIAVLERGRMRLRRRVSVVAVGLATLLMSGTAWRLGHANRFACAIPKDRVAAAWTPGDAADPRRQTIHRAFAASGRATAETSWSRLSKVLDDYMSAWGAMYLHACESTNVHGEQSAEVLDLRMSCLRDNLDQVGVLTDALVAADGEALSHAVSAALDLTPVARCADISLLKSAVPLPRDESTLRQVEALRRSIREIEGLRAIGRSSVALAKAVALRPRVEATGFRPLMGELLEETGQIQCDRFDRETERTLEEAVFVAEASHDDATRAKAAATLIYVAGYQLNRAQDAERWARLAIAILDRLGAGHARTRAWALQNHAVVLGEAGQLEAAKTLYEQAIPLKEQTVGRDHPDVAISVQNLAETLNELGRPQDALPLTERAMAILETNSDPGSALFANALIAKAETLLLLGRDAESKPLFQRAREIFGALDTEHPYLSGALDGLGRIELDEGNPSAAIPLLEEAMRVSARHQGAPLFLAGTRYALARALWTRRADRPRALQLAEAARALYARGKRPKEEREIARWLSTHRGRTAASAR